MKKIFISKFVFFQNFVSLTPLINIHSRVSPRISKKFEMVLMGYSGARGTLIYEKNLISKISCQTLFKTAKGNVPKPDKTVSWIDTTLDPHLFLKDTTFNMKNLYIKGWMCF
jgi:hypothetical protein